MPTDPDLVSLPVFCPQSLRSSPLGECAGRRAICSCFFGRLEARGAPAHRPPPPLLQKQVVFQEKIVSQREAEYGRLKKERDERVRQLVAERRRERETKRKLIFFVKSEEERLARQREEEEARKQEGDDLLPRSCADSGALPPPP